MYLISLPNNSAKKVLCGVCVCVCVAVCAYVQMGVCLCACMLCKCLDKNNHMKEF